MKIIKLLKLFGLKCRVEYHRAKALKEFDKNGRFDNPKFDKYSDDFHRVAVRFSRLQLELKQQKS